MRKKKRKWYTFFVLDRDPHQVCGIDSWVVPWCWCWLRLLAAWLDSSVVVEDRRQCWIWHGSKAAPFGLVFDGGDVLSWWRFQIVWIRDCSDGFRWCCVVSMARRRFQIDLVMVRLWLLLWWKLFLLLSISLQVWDWWDFIRCGWSLVSWLYCSCIVLIETGSCWWIWDCYDWWKVSTVDWCFRIVVCFDEFDEFLAVKLFWFWWIGPPFCVCVQVYFIVQGLGC